MLTIWDQLSRIERFAIRAAAYAGSRSGWAGQGAGTVTATTTSDTVRFAETGHFRPADALRRMSISNQYVWRLENGGLSLSHERFGRNEARPLVIFTPAGDGGALVASRAHRCGADDYDAALGVDSRGVWLSWRIYGPDKNESLSIRYLAGDGGLSDG